jgi:hypothetical protein
VNTADDSKDVPNVDKDTKKYADFKLSNAEWDRVELVHECLKVVPDSFAMTRMTVLTLLMQESWLMHEEFSGEILPSLWKVLPSLEAFLAKWTAMRNDLRFLPVREALSAGIRTLEKYYDKTDNSPANIVCLCT